MTKKTTASANLTRADLLDRVWEDPLGVVAQEVGLTANGLAKLCDRLEIPRPRRSHWRLSNEERGAAKPDLPPPPPDIGETALLNGERQRRRRTRLTIEERRTQLLDEAANVIAEDGVSEVSLKRLARTIGISEAQAHNCFRRRIDLLVELARRELAELEKARKGVVSRGPDPVAAVVLSTEAYFDEAQRRGPLLQELLMAPDIRRALRDEQDETLKQIRAPMLASMQERYGMSESEAFGANAILSAVILRTGSLLANGRIARPVATRLGTSVLLSGIRSNANTARITSQRKSRKKPSKGAD